MRCHLHYYSSLYPLAFPHAACVVFGARDYCVALVVECSREDLVGVPLEHLQVVAILDVPHAARPVARGGDDLVALRVEGDLGDLALVAWSGLGLGLGLG